MKKSLIALAVAGVVSAPAFAATSNVDVYGIMNIAIEKTDGGGAGKEDLAVVDNVSRIGFKGSEDLGGGLKAVWQIESGVSGGSAIGGNSVGAGTLAGRNTFVGLAGGFGTFVMGRHDTPYKMATGKYDIMGDTLGDYNGGVTGTAGNNASLNGTSRLGVDLLNATHDHRSTAAIAYISPSFSGLTVAAAVVASNVDGFNDAGKDMDAVSLAAMYANGPLTVDLAYQDVNVVDSKALKLGVGYAFGDTKVGFVYEDINGAAADDRDSWLVNVVHSMGPISLKAVYGQVDDNATDADMWAIGADYNLSKRTAAYFVYGSGDVDGGTEIDGFNIGVKHSF